MVDRPSYFCSPGEYDDLLSFVIIGVMFLWDVYVLSDDGRIVFYSHDEIREIGRRGVEGAVGFA